VVGQRQPWRRRYWRGLSLQLFLVFLLPLTLLLLLVAVGGSLLHQQAMRDLVGERDERSARAAAAAVSEQLEERATAVEALAQRSARTAMPAEALSDLAPLLPVFDGGIGLFGLDGTLLATSDPQQAWINLIPDLQRDGLVRTGPSFFFAPRDEITNTAIDGLLVAAAVVDGYVAAGAFSPAELARNALSRVFRSGEAASAFVVTSNGEVIYSSGPLPADTTLLSHPGVASALRGESGTTYITNEDGEHIVAFSPITPVGWAMVIDEPWHAVADPLLRTTEWAPLLLAPALIIALIGLTFGARQIVQPLQSLEDKATALGWGDFAAIEEPVGGIAEIQRLQNELVHMAQKVRHAQHSLRDYLGAVTAGQEEERRRLARELHDDTIQTLIALNQRIQLAQMAQPEPAQLGEMQEMVSGLIADLRRTIHALRPIYLEDLGLVPALQMLAREVGEGTDLAVTFESSGKARRLEPEVELALYRIAQEALSNVMRHAGAGFASVALTFADDTVKLAISDDGAGFAVPESPAEFARQAHFGLLGIYERAELVGADLALVSHRGEGTRLQVVVPAALH
jgi:signal transduction histidine kinase